MDNRSKILDMLISDKASIKQAIGLIDRNGQRVVFVVDGKKKILGSATDGDVRRAILRGVGIDEHIASIMNTDPLVAEDSWDFFRINKFLRSNRVIARGPFEYFKIPLVNKTKEVVDILDVRGDKFSRFSENKFSGWRSPNVRKILVIGGGGYTGSVLVHDLLDRGYDVNVLDAFLYGYDSLKDIESRRNLRIVKGDTRHVEDLTDAMRDVDAVVHLAEIVGDYACSINPEITVQTNYLATRLIASMCKYFQINRLIYTSSCSVYGATESEELLNEESELRPVSLYARMKIASERALLEMRDENFAPTILRLATVYGKSFRPRFDLVVNLLTARAVKGKIITILGGKQWRPNVHVRDVGEFIIKILKAPIQEVGGQIFNCGSNEQNYRIEELGDIVHEVVPDARIQIETGATDIRNYKVDFGKARSELHFVPSKQIEDGVREIKDLIEYGKVNYEDKRYSNVQWLKNGHA